MRAAAATTRCCRAWDCTWTPWSRRPQTSSAPRLSWLPSLPPRLWRWPHAPVCGTWPGGSGTRPVGTGANQTQRTVTGSTSVPGPLGACETSVQKGSVSDHNQSEVHSLPPRPPPLPLRPVLSSRLWSPFLQAFRFLFLRSAHPQTPLLLCMLVSWRGSAVSLMTLGILFRKLGIHLEHSKIVKSGSGPWGAFCTRCQCQKGPVGICIPRPLLSSLQPPQTLDRSPNCDAEYVI